jgi:quercetin dioxygenase-like cupin family protein
MTARPQGVATLIESNDRVIITEWRLAPGGETGWHEHELDYVVVYRTAAKHLIETPDTKLELDVPAGRAYFRNAGIEHNVVNAGDAEVVFVKTEIR